MIDLYNIFQNMTPELNITGYKSRSEKEIAEYMSSKIEFPRLKKDQTVQW